MNFVELPFVVEALAVDVNLSIHHLEVVLGRAGLREDQRSLILAVEEEDLLGITIILTEKHCGVREGLEVDAMEDKNQHFVIIPLQHVLIDIVEDSS